mmetsp:Transcript_3194/g.7526  ORF Transcript_3194/g.7526 Transcript_3194/m.7526 type:complete len:361 (+) Transcript_3194:202-1284(+)|eukprot:CAMPEP_0178986644 /NCGR_PEP_ID=MMETSP0795-20121207/2817_1 /TAXON_ID=88552 /ORGANISM="Amoebophrya sp., Strain Ameob2" /LENGTH=360 /DNA_ID=CAMNT_0020677725 /DNA_START=150 /DNA_END=1232 /DNA_ORIENTATION=+
MGSRATSSYDVAEVGARYAADGVVSPVSGVFEDDARIFRDKYVPLYEKFRERCRQIDAENESASGRSSSTSGSSSCWSEYRFKSHLFLPWLHDLLVNSDRLQALARRLLKTDTVVIWSTDWCVKPGRPRDGDLYFSWHQDSTYSHFPEGVTVWIAFSEITAGSGPVQFVRNSHNCGQLPHVEKSKTQDPHNMLAFGQTIPDEIIDEIKLRAEDVARGGKEAFFSAHPLLPGELSAHSFLTVHSSQPNREDKDRVGLAVRLVPGKSGEGGGTGRPERKDRVTLLCGAAAPMADKDIGGFQLETHVPETEFGEKEMAEWELSMKVEKEFYFGTGRAATAAAAAATRKTGPDQLLFVAENKYR